MSKKTTNVGKLLYEVRKYIRAQEREPEARQLELFPNLNTQSNEVQKIKTDKS